MLCAHLCFESKTGKTIMNPEDDRANAQTKTDETHAHKPNSAHGRNVHPAPKLLSAAQPPTRQLLLV